MKTKLLFPCLFLLAFCNFHLLNAQVTVTGSTSEDADYLTLREAFTAINGASQTGNNIIITITDNTDESSVSAVLNAGAWTSLKIYPTSTGLTISGDVEGPLIDLNGADNVTIDGRVDASGTTKDLIITNTSTSAVAGTSTIRFTNDATGNTVKYCTIKGSTTVIPDGSSTGSGVIFFSTATTIGNNNNIIDHNDITNADDIDNVNRPLCSIYSLGTATYVNSSNTISNNNFFDFLHHSYTTYGIYLGNNTTTWTISGNSFYETGEFTALADISYDVIYIISGSGYMISSNYIGGTLSNCGGESWVKSSFSTPFTAISLTSSSGSVNNIQGNIISKIYWANGGMGNFTGIKITGTGSANIGTTEGNIIGSTTVTESITYENTGQNGLLTGISISNNGVVECKNNKIGGLITSNLNPISSANFMGISITESGNSTISNNTIGSTTLASSIELSSTSSTDAQTAYGIYNTGTGEVTISGNTIANLINNTTNATVTTTGLVNGIYVSAGSNTITGNTIRDLTIANANNRTDYAASVGGIVINNTTSTVQTISGNTIYNLSNTTNTSFTGNVTGIYYYGGTTASNITGNFIHSLTVGPSNTGANIYGFKINAGATTYSNNIIYLGGNTTSTVYGIYETGAAGNNNNLYFNTVYIDGSPTSGALNSYALYSAVTTNTRDFRNNIFDNARNNNGASGKHYAAYFASNPGAAGLTEDYNDYYAPGASGGTLGYFNGSDVTSLAAWKTATGQDANSLNTTPSFSISGGTSPWNYIALTALAGVTGTGITTDYAGTTRPATPNMGAYELVPATITSFTPSTAGTGATITITGTNFTGASTVKFGGTDAASFTVVSSTSITAVVANGTTGTISISTPSGTATSIGTFTLNPPYLSNINNAINNTITGYSSKFLGQAFKTGFAGLSISSVDLSIGSNPPVGIEAVVKLYSSTADGKIGSLIASLRGTTVGGIINFKPVTPITLSASTIYWLVMYSTGTVSSPIRYANTTLTTTSYNYSNSLIPTTPRTAISTNTGGSWTYYNSGSINAYPFLFALYGDIVASWTGATSTDWNTLDNWNTSEVPTSTTTVILPPATNQPVISSSATCNNLTIGSGAYLTINSGQTLTVGGSVIIESSSLASTGSLLVNGTLSVEGTVSYKRWMTGGQWHLLSSPVTGQSISALLADNKSIPTTTGNLRGMMDYNETTNLWNGYFSSATAGNLISGTGYCVRTYNDDVVTFTGALQNDDVTFTLPRNGPGWNLTGNPYPTALALKGTGTDFIPYNSANLDQSFVAVYIWDPVAGSYTIVNNISGQQQVMPGQGFFVRTLSNGASLSLTKAMRAQPNSSFMFAKSATAAIPTVKISSTAGTLKSETSILFDQSATTGLDAGFDAGIFKRGTLDIYTRLVDDNGVDFAIQVLPGYITDTYEIPVGADYIAGGLIKFAISYSDLPAGYQVRFEDRQDNIFTDIKAGLGEYSLVLPANSLGTGRFFIHIGNITTPVEETKENKLLVYKSGSSVYIKGTVDIKAQLFLVSADGRILKNLRAKSTDLNELDVTGYLPGVYFVIVKDSHLYKPVKIALMINR